MDLRPQRTDKHIREILETYKDMVYRLAFSLTKTRHDADDIFQEVFLRYIKKERSFKSEEHRRAWLIRVTINCAKSFFSSAWRKHTLPIEQSHSAVPDTGYELMDAVKSLPKNYAALIHLFYYEGLKAEELAAALKLKPSTVRMRLTRARRMLKQILTGDDNNEK